MSPRPSNPLRANTRIPRPDEIALSLGELAKPIHQYTWIVAEVRRRDVSSDPEFQRRFNHFWRVRKNAAWRSAFYDLFEASKSDGVEFPTALRRLHERTGTVEASFSSKLVATLDPGRPVLDAFVLKFFGLRLPYPHHSDRLGRTIEVYRDVEKGLARIVRSDAMPVIREAFDRQYPDAGLSDTKMVDFVLWQIREPG